jgi:hypothetical protein
MGFFAHRGIKYDLGKALAITQIDKNTASVISTIVDPTCEDDSAAYVSATKGIAMVGTGVLRKKFAHEVEECIRQ